MKAYKDREKAIKAGARDGLFVRKTPKGGVLLEIWSCGIHTYDLDLDLEAVASLADTLTRHLNGECDA